MYVGETRARKSTHGMNWCVDGAPSLTVARSSVGFTAQGKTLKRPPHMLVGSLRKATPILSSLSVLPKPPKLPTSRRGPAQRM